jgi:hypothetical protein
VPHRPRRAKRAWEKAVSHATSAFMVARDRFFAETAVSNAAAKAVERPMTVRLKGTFS